MQKVSVKAVEGRLAFTASRGGAKIPHDKYVEVDETEWIKRLRDVHGDIVQEVAKTEPLPKPKDLKPNSPADNK